MRKKVAEKIRISAVIKIPAALEPVKGIDLPIDGSQFYLLKGEISFSLLSIEENSTHFRVSLDTEVDLPEDLTDEELTQTIDIGKRNSCSLFIPGFNGSYGVLDNPFELYYQLKLVVWKLVFAADDVRFLRELDDKNMGEYFGPLTITCRGRSATSTIQKECFPRFADSGPFRPATHLTKDKVQQCLSTQLENYEKYCVLSDIEYPRGRLDVVVILLVTMLETEAYEAAKRILQVNDPKNFNPALYLGDIKNYLKAVTPFSQCNPKLYGDCHELWGARHEVVHNGRNAVRQYDGKHDVIEANLRDLSGRDIKNFRVASLAAIEWMRRLP